MIEIKNTVNRFANSFDSKDWSSLREVLAHQVVCDYTGLRGTKERIQADRYVEQRLHSLSDLKTHHLLSNHEVRVDKDVAFCRASAMIWRTNGSRDFHTHAQYEFRLKLEKQAWVITSIKQLVLWNTGDKSIHGGAM